MASKKRVPLFKWPSNIVWIDDSIDFAEQQAGALISKGHELCFKFFQDAKSALVHLKESCQEDPLYQLPLPSENTESRAYTASFNFDSNLDCFLSAEKFNHVACVVVDQNMPGMQGNEFCRQLEVLGYPLMRIMVTGEANADFGNDLLSMEETEAFIRKGDNGLDEKLVVRLEHFLHQHFLNLSAPYLSAIKMNERSPLNSDLFFDFFNGLVLEHNIVEHVIINANGSAVLRDGKGKVWFLAVASAGELKEFSAMFADNGLLPGEYSFVEEVARYARVPFFLNAEDEAKPFGEWGAYFHSSKAVPNLSNFYYAFMDDLGVYQDQFKNLQSYQAYFDAFYEDE